MVQATSPFVVSADFDNAISQLKKEKADSLLSCVRVKKFFWEEKGNQLIINIHKDQEGKILTEF